MISSFIPTVHFGILVRVAMLGGLAGNLVILRLLLSVLPAARNDRKAVPRAVRHTQRPQKVP